MLEIKEINHSKTPNILILGIGGGGNNAVERMIDFETHPVSFAVINTDLDVLQNCKAMQKVQIGKKLTSGFGAGGDPSVGAASAEESHDELTALLEGTDLVIMTCGLGGGTGTGAVHIVSKMCKEMDILSVAVVTLPFSFEGKPKENIAQVGLEKLKETVDTLLVIPNDKLLAISNKSFYLDDAFVMADSVLRHTVQAITNIIFNTGTVNLDFNDLKSVLKNKGLAHLGIGMADKEEELVDAVKQAIHSPLLNTNISNAENVLINTSGRVDLLALNEAIAYIREIVDENVNICWGTVPVTEENGIVITIIATGLSENTETAELPNATRKKTLQQTETEVPIYRQNKIDPLKNKNPQIERDLKSDVKIPPFIKAYIK